MNLYNTFKTHLLRKPLIIFNLYEGFTQKYIHRTPIVANCSTKYKIHKEFLWWIVIVYQKSPGTKSITFFVRKLQSHYIILFHLDHRYNYFFFLAY